MRKLQRQIKRGFIDRIKPGNKPKDTGFAMQVLAGQPSFKQWRLNLAANARAWTRRYGKKQQKQLV